MSEAARRAAPGRSSKVSAEAASNGKASARRSQGEFERTAWHRGPQMLLRLLGRDADPASSRAHVVLSLLAERRLRPDEPSDLASLLEDLAQLPIDRMGALAIDEFLPKRERAALAAALVAFLASPTFATWRTGTQLDISSWLTAKDGRTPAEIVSVAHLDDDERALVLGVLLEEILTWVRGFIGQQEIAGSGRIRRGVRLPAAASGESTDEAAVGVVDEASARVRSRRRDRDAESDGSRLQGARECGHVVRRATADGC